MAQMKINKSLIPIKVHYFLRYAGTAFLTLSLPLIVRQKGISAQGIGFLWSTMPIVGLLTNSFSGALADYFRAHRSVFLLSLIFLTAGLVGMYGLPVIPSQEDNYDNEILLRENIGSGDISIKNFTMSEEMSMNFFLKNLTKSQSINKETELFQEIAEPELIMDEGQPILPNPKMTSVDQSTLSYLMQFPQFWLVFLAIMIEQMGISTCVMISDAVCFQILGSKRHNYGRQRVWGTIGMGLLSVVTGALVDIYSKGLPQTDYLPAVIICIVFMGADIILVCKMNIPSSKERKIKMGDVGHVLVHPQTMAFFGTVFVMGVSLGFLWVFKMLYIEDVALAWSPNYENLKLLQGLDLCIETFGGEVPFFFLSGMIIKHLGHSKVFVICNIAMALRCILYFTISNPWWFLPVEFLNGISYALFHACMASYASHIAPPGAQATLQALVRACFSIGMSTAGFFGGLLYQSIGGAAMFLSLGLLNLGFCFLMMICQTIITKYYNHQKLLGHSGYEAQARSSSSSDGHSGTSDNVEQKVKAGIEEIENGDEKEEEAKIIEKLLIEDV